MNCFSQHLRNTRGFRGVTLIVTVGIGAGERRKREVDWTSRREEDRWEGI